MKFGQVSLRLASSLVAAIPATATAQDTEVTAAQTYVATVDASAFRPPHRPKHGVIVDPADVRLITPGVDKFSIYRLIGTPHFGEGITRRWNYVLLFPPASEGGARERCRMEIRFERRDGRYDVVVSEVVWQEQACADRVASAS